MAKRKRKQIVTRHILIPTHIKLSAKQRDEVLAKYNISLKELPKIKKDDPAIARLNVKEGDIVKIIRKSPTAGETEFYRGVISE